MNQFGKVIVSAEEMKVFTPEGEAYTAGIPEDFSSVVYMVLLGLLDAGYDENPVIYMGPFPVQLELMKQGYRFQRCLMNGRVRTIAYGIEVEV